jgi:hypothetical protein
MQQGQADPIDGSTENVGRGKCFTMDDTSSSYFVKVTLLPDKGVFPNKSQ